MKTRSKKYDKYSAATSCEIAFRWWFTLAIASARFDATAMRRVFASVSSVNASVSFVEVEEIGMNNHENKNKKKNDNNEDKYKEEDGNSEEDEEIVYNPSRFRR